MSELRFTCHKTVLACLFYVALTRPSHAYVDPGSASIVVAAILGGVAAIGYTMRLYWERFKGLFRRKQQPTHK